MKGICTALLAMLVSGPGLGIGWQAPVQKSRKTQTPAVTKAKRPKRPLCAISGFAFAITKGGDLKPARMAKVYVLEPEP